MPPRRRSLRVTGLAATALAWALMMGLALWPQPSAAQTPPLASDLFQPSPLGNSNPQNPPRFGSSANRAPPANRFTAVVAGSTPIYGSPTGFGAGDTGFDSSNKPHRRRTARTPVAGSEIAPPQQMTFDQVGEPPPQVPSTVPILPPPPPPQIFPLRAASRPGAALPPWPEPPPLSNPPAVVYPASAASRAGAVLAIPPPDFFVASASTPPPGTPPPNTLPLGTVPHATLPFLGPDPYEALGIKAGSFLILPALESSAAYSNNFTHSPGGPPSYYFVMAPELHVRSDWSTHSFTADVVASYTDYQTAVIPSLNAPYLNAKIDGRIDATRDTQFLLESRVIMSTYSPGSPNITAGLAKLPILTTVGGTFGIDEHFSRFDVTLKGTFDRSTEQNSDLTNGQSVSSDYVNFDQYASVMRLGYEIDPGLKPFVEVGADERIHDQVDQFGENRNSIGESGKLGATLNLTGSLIGEMAVGYMERDYIYPLPDVGGPTVDGTLLWQIDGLNTAKFTAASTINESVLQGVSAAFSRDFSIEVDHALRRWLVLIGQAGYGHDNYAGLGREDNRYFLSAGLVYKLNREMQLKGTVRQDWLTSSVTGVAYHATSMLVGLRLQR